MAWRAGEVVLKPLDMSPEALEWQEGLLAALTADDGFRVAAPLRSRGGALVVEGWTACPALAGSHAPRWEEILAVGERFHDALAGVDRPTPLLAARTDPWARADRIAWGELPSGDFADVPEVARLLCALPEGRDRVQLMIRALLFRLLAHPDPAGQAGSYRPALTCVLDV